MAEEQMPGIIGSGIGVGPAGEFPPQRWSTSGEAMPDVGRIVSWS